MRETTGRVGLRGAAWSGRKQVRDMSAAQRGVGRISTSQNLCHPAPKVSHRKRTTHSSYCIRTRQPGMNRVQLGISALGLEALLGGVFSSDGEQFDKIAYASPVPPLPRQPPPTTAKLMVPTVSQKTFRRM